MPALLRLLFAFGTRFLPWLSVVGSFFSVAGSLVSGFVSGAASRYWPWVVWAVKALLSYLPVILFFTGIILVSNLLLSVFAFVLYHVNAFLTLGLSPYVTIGTVRIIGNAFLGVLSYYLVVFSLFLARLVSDAVPSPPASAPSGPIGISALKK